MNDWMKALPNELQVSEINLPGTHNSATKKVRFSFISQCQKHSIFDQLNIGIRFLDIRVEAVDDRLKLVHSISDCFKPSGKKKRLFLEDVIDDCRRFLNENPSETIIFSLKRDDGESQETVFDIFFKNYLSDDVLWYKENRIPTLNEVRGKLVLLRRCCIDKKNQIYNDFNTGLDFSQWPDHSKFIEGGFEAVSIPTLSGASSGTYFLQDMYKLKPEDKWNKAILPLLKNPPTDEGIILNFFTASSGLNTPTKYAKYVYTRFKNEELRAKIKYGWLILDFPTKAICEKIIQTNFK